MAPVLRSSQNIETAFFQTRPMTEAEKADAARKREVRCRDILLKGPIEELSQRTQNRYKRYWKAVDILAEGNGIVALWTYTGSDYYRISLPRQVVVKQMVDYRKHQPHIEELDVGARIHAHLNAQSSSHIVQLPSKGNQLTDKTLREMGVRNDSYWLRHIHRIITEYCELGDLSDLILRRLEIENEADQKFQERTLWHFFDCMVDAISVLNEVFEYAYDRATQKAVRPAVAYSVWYPYVHLDAKLRNWFVKIDPTTLSNPAMPVLKLGDFGFTGELVPDLQQNLNSDYVLSWRNNFSRRGTPGFFTPHANSGDDGIVGKFGPATNVWALGLNMVLLAELKEAHEDGAHNSQGIRTTGLEKANPEPILPNFQIDGRQADGRTYCLSLRDEAYSDELKDLIFQCLYEKPALRPTCQETKQRIGLALDRIYPKEGPKQLPEHLDSIGG
ncbi:Protein kinase-like (PK-like) [Glarea lozoyensis ATCC 20868]|uniref:non-specific serine/threonine protein kinase n=1 Tax=Glarea lozoyensis (strain ATCC 20868 / MF5171) TaxID=1116229 RepID=S3CX19_GLAL2|nr:Protein kinase-like (PK-like) [Glarea lozoyensis ATCC 20868]EPE30892.1 Protein kinase-like (PK-like) [Glarea lozoyensis ATCC 20868]